MAATECRMLHLPHEAIRKLLDDQPKYWQSNHCSVCKKMHV
jgi:hypothetical protein